MKTAKITLEELLKCKNTLGGCSNCGRVPNCPIIDWAITQRLSAEQLFDAIQSQARDMIKNNQLEIQFSFKEEN